MPDVETIDEWRNQTRLSLKRLCERLAVEALTHKELCTRTYVGKVLMAVEFFTLEPLQAVSKGMRPFVLVALSDDEASVTPWQMQQVAVLYQGAAVGLEFVR